MRRSPAHECITENVALKFRPLNEEQEIHRTHGALPHWSQAGAVHFVTFRQGDSLPKDVMERWYAERKEWLELRGESPEREGWFERLSPDHRREYGQRFGKKIQDQMDRGLGSCLLRKKENAAAVVSALKFFAGERYDLGDFVVMPNHVHALVIPREGWRMNEILKSWKSYTARVINENEDLSGAFWQRESFDHIVRTRKQLDRLREYIAENPLKARLPVGSYWHETAVWE